MGFCSASHCAEHTDTPHRQATPLWWDTEIAKEDRHDR